MKAVAKAFTGAENVLATLALAGIMLLPLAEIAMRLLLHRGIPGAGPFTLNLTIWVGLLGAAIGAREGKLLTLATGEFLPKGTINVAHVISGFAGAATTLLVVLVTLLATPPLLRLPRPTKAPAGRRWTRAFIPRC